ncbi:hypothetical protein GPA19_23670 [Azoarcus indigens]|uniref:DUF2971 family protein n=1 Tax=Azoarcus indigens TaxID=29545 RepID=A0A4R6DP35_9RHOO|nr:DUF2971 domain-containing protein [Azoarcus indigens]NMG67945.1 hypothetical protein [Azoarcus indigens]TDN46741.1 hypothetical protein C7389_12648 [Azoarcus indigens]
MIGASQLRLYKYKSLQNLWHVLDIAVNERLYCAHWAELNDPLEGRYEVYLGSPGTRIRKLMVGRIEKARNKYRIASLSADPANFLLWSHYADGCKGVAIEVEIPDQHVDLSEVIYSPFSSVFTKEIQTQEEMHHLFKGKGEEWAYEREYRLVVPRKYFQLPQPATRLLLGPLVSAEQRKLLAAVLPRHIEIFQTELDRTQGTLVVTSPYPSLWRTAFGCR